MILIPRALLLLAIGTSIAAGTVLQAQAVVGAESKSPRVFSLSREGLTAVKAMIARDDPSIRGSWQRLVKEADEALDVGPFSVVLKSKVPPSGNKHDYASIAPYLWPDPAKRDGLPYVGRDGFTNPEWWQDYDRVPLERLTQATEDLALAYFFTGKPAYAQRAAHLLRVWFLDPGTAMTPDLQFAQASPGTNPGRCHPIDTRFLPRVIDAVGLLGGSPAWTPADQAGMVAWFRTFVANQRRRADDEYRPLGTNISSFYHAQIAAQALFIGDDALAREMIARTQTRMEAMVGADGFFLPERKRTRSFSYSSFHLFALFNLATLGRHVGLDLWNFATDDGRGFRKALETVAAHAGSYPPKAWPFSETGHTHGDWWDPVHDQLPVVLFHAAQAYGEKSFADRATQVLAASDGLDANRLHVLCGLQLIGQQSIHGWLFRPSSVESH
jgi:hypothetical protein